MWCLTDFIKNNTFRVRCKFCFKVVRYFSQVVYIYIHAYRLFQRTRILQKVLSLTQKELKKENSFSLYFNVVPFDINAFALTIQRYCNPGMKAKDISTAHMTSLLFLEWWPPRWYFSLGNKKSDGGKSCE